MPSKLIDSLVSLTYPPALSACLAVLGLVVLLMRWRRLAIATWAVALGWSLLWSIPAASDALRATLERRHPVIDEARLPKADAIVVLGGGDPRWWLDRGVADPYQLPRSRIAAGARAWLARRAPVVVLSGGGARGRTEAEMMARAIRHLGVPAHALLLETRSRSTLDNARFTAALAREHGFRRILLVTSALHMPRAMRLFGNTGVEAIPVPVPETPRRSGWRERWLPSGSALWRSGRALKEYAALVAVRLHG